MPPDLTKFHIELLCDTPLWDNFNVYLMVVCYGVDGERVAFNTLEDRVRSADEPGSPTGGPRRVELVTDSCVSGEIYAYVVPETLPDSRVIRDTPPFELILKVCSPAGETRDAYSVDQLGGLTIVARPFGR